MMIQIGSLTRVMFFGLATLVLAATLEVQGAAATIEVVTLVTQPIATHDSGLWIVDVPVLSAGSMWDAAWALVEMTNQRLPLQPPPGGDQHPEGRNAADLMGLRIRVVKNAQKRAGTRQTPPGLFGDTLRVELDVSGPLNRSSFGLRPEVVVPATIHCMLANARRSQGLFKYLDLRVRGDERFAGASRVYSEKDFPDTCGAWQFQVGKANRPN